jgi:hypothetical protein
MNLRSRIKVVTHIFEPFDDGLDALLEIDPRQILIDLLHLGLLALPDEARARELKE